MKNLLRILPILIAAVLICSCGSGKAESAFHGGGSTPYQDTPNPSNETVLKSDLSKVDEADLTSYDIQWSGWTLEKFMEESSCIFLGKCLEKLKTRQGSSELRFEIKLDVCPRLNRCEKRGGSMRTISMPPSEDAENHLLLEKLYLQYRKQMLLTARSVLGSDAEAEDVVHDVFLRISQKHLSKLSRINSEYELRNYLLKAVKNTALSFLRSKDRDQVSLDALSEESLSGIANLSDKDFIDEICKSADYETCLRAINSLPPIYRDVLYYHFALEYSIPEVAKFLNLKRSTIKQQLVRGKKLLLKRLGERYFGGET